MLKQLANLDANQNLSTSLTNQSPTYTGNFSSTPHNASSKMTATSTITEKQDKLLTLINELKQNNALDQEALNKLEQIQLVADQAMQNAITYERKLKLVENFANSHSLSYSRMDNNGSTVYENMISMFEDIYEAEDLSNTIKIYQNFKESNLHFCFMWASPVVIFKEAALDSRPIAQTIPWEIGYNQELGRIKKTLKAVGCDIKFISSRASSSTFVDIMKKNPMILHFCGHGVDNSRNTRYKGSLEENVDNYYLVFEDEMGRGELISCDFLDSMVRAAYKVRVVDSRAKITLSLCLWRVAILRLLHRYLWLLVQVMLFVLLRMRRFLMRFARLLQNTTTKLISAKTKPSVKPLNPPRGRYQLTKYSMEKKRSSNSCYEVHI